MKVNIRYTVDLEDVLDENGKYIDKTYQCSNPFGKCDNCCQFLK